jgi:hypothetical protein
MNGTNAYNILIPNAKTDYWGDLSIEWKNNI